MVEQFSCCSFEHLSLEDSRSLGRFSLPWKILAVLEASRSLGRFSLSWKLLALLEASRSLGSFSLSWKLLALLEASRSLGSFSLSWKLLTVSVGRLISFLLFQLAVSEASCCFCWPS